MAKIEKNVVIDVTTLPIEQLTIHGNNLLGLVEIEASYLEMEAIIKMNPQKPETMNSSYARSFYKELESKNIICAKVSTELAEKLKSKNIDLVGKFIKADKYGEPTSIINYADEFDIENVKDNFEFDFSNQSTFAKNGIKFKIRIYYIITYDRVIISW